MDLEKPVLTDVPVMEIYPEADTKPEADVLATPTVTGEVVTDGKKSKAGKKRTKAPWAKLLSQYYQNAQCSPPPPPVGNIEDPVTTTSEPNDAQSQKAYTIEDYLKITEEQIKASSPGKSQTEDQIQTQEPAVQSQPEVTSRETMAASPPRQD
ncbi:hypothetical protein YC2023_068364 [Brassica napus]|uniref:Uncharacterized protein n=1 Tax=Brassica campestris TaxID=3711 RepID=M4DDM2_BRACM|nr:unnamed protein product [Brassica rapa]